MATSNVSRAVQADRVNLRAVALPAEHGAWGLLLEPVALGLLVASSGAGVALAIAAILGFLARQPLRLALADRLRGHAGARVSLAWRVAGMELLAALLAFAIAWRTAAQGFWIPLALALPIAGLHFAYDVRYRGRALVPELLGAGAAGGIASSIALAGGWPAPLAWLLWLLVAARALPSVLFVRARLRLDRGIETSAIPSHASHVAALALPCVLAMFERLPWLACAPYALLLLRAILGLGARRRKVRPQVLGAAEVAFGAATVLLLALAFALG